MMYRFFALASLISVAPGLYAPGCDGDSDLDGLTDSVDNCGEVYNPAQADEDADGLGDACDTSTPQHKLDAGGCFSSDWPPLRGVNWEDRPTLIEQGDVDATRIYVSIDWTSSDSDWIERGEGSTNGKDVWFDIRDEHNPYLYTRTIVEGAGVDNDGDGRIDAFTGTYLMLECETNDPTYCDNGNYELWTDGEWTATRMNSLECNNL